MEWGFDLNPYVYYGLALVTLVLSAGRLTRLLVADAWPPSIWVRTTWDRATGDGNWSKLVHCHWCFGPWATAIVGGWALLSHLHWSWWLVNGWFALSYLTSMVVERDEIVGG